MPSAEAKRTLVEACISWRRLTSVLLIALVLIQAPGLSILPRDYAAAQELIDPEKDNEDGELWALPHGERRSHSRGKSTGRQRPKPGLTASTRDSAFLAWFAPAQQLAQANFAKRLGIGAPMRC